MRRILEKGCCMYGVRWKFGHLSMDWEDQACLLWTEITAFPSSVLNFQLEIDEIVEMIDQFIEYYLYFVLNPIGLRRTKIIKDLIR